MTDWAKYHPSSLAPGESLVDIPEEICLCGQPKVFHRIDTKKMARDQGDCEGFVLDVLRWRITRWADVKFT